jgi:uncharacterized protein YkvS
LKFSPIPGANSQTWYGIASRAQVWGYELSDILPSLDDSDIWFAISSAANVEGNLALDRQIRQAGLSIGDRVAFDYRGDVLRGQVVKINRATVIVDGTKTGDRWQVAKELVRKEQPLPMRGPMAHEVTVISERGTEVGVLEGNTVRITARPANG